MIADEPADFAAKVASVLENPGLRETLSINGRRAVEASYDWAKLGARYCDFVDEITLAGHTAPRAIAAGASLAVARVQSEQQPVAHH